MPVKKQTATQKSLIDAIAGAFSDKKAINPVLLDFRDIQGAICDVFMICHGNSRTQTEAIAHHVTGEVKKHTGANPWHQEGFENAEWILIDYVDVVVHIFQEERRKFYNLEQLWADAKISGLDPGQKKSKSIK